MSTDKRTALEDALRRELKTFSDLSLPDDDSAKPWRPVRNCLFCGKRHCAKVNYAIGWYKCFSESCKRDVSAGDSDVTARFWPQIQQAARHVCGRWDCVNSEDARSYAAERVLTYAGNPAEGDADAGQLPEWETQVKGDPDQLDRYVLRALACDLKTWAGRIARDVARQIPAAAVGDDDGQTETIDDIAERQVAPDTSGYGSLSEYTVLCMFYGDGYTYAEIAAQLGKSVSTVQRMLTAEKNSLRNHAEPPGYKRPKPKPKPTDPHYFRQRNGVACAAGCAYCQLIRSEAAILAKWRAQHLCRKLHNAPTLLLVA